MEMFILWYWVGCVMSFLVSIVYISLLHIFELGEKKDVYFYVKGILLYMLFSWAGVAIFLVCVCKVVKKYLKRSAL